MPRVTLSVFVLEDSEGWAGLGWAGLAGLGWARAVFVRRRVLTCP